MTTVYAKGLEKRFGALRALDGVGFTAGTGVTGLLGPNGAGKTTLLRCLATTEAPDGGTLRLLGLDPARPDQRVAFRRRLGYLPQEPGFYGSFTAAEFLDYVAILKELVEVSRRRAEVRRVLAEVDLTDRAATKVRKLSGGMRRRLGLAQALLGDPEVLLLDEPTAGLDPEQRLRFRDLISRLGEQRTVLLSTHQTEDVAALCEHVVVLDRGAVRFEGAPRQLVELASGQVWLGPSRAADARVTWRDPDGQYRSLGGRPPADAAPAAPTLEDGYLLLVGEAARSVAA
jgi:ABC-2 type transport system ATP-binding protein